MPARFWKWRMHGGALTLARRLRATIAVDAAATPDLVVATDMLDVTTFLALLREELAGVPVVLYMHENQITYPLPESPVARPRSCELDGRDMHYGMINVASMLAADAVVFNSEFHRLSLLAALPGFLGHFPEYREQGSVADIEAKSLVLPPGIDVDPGAGASRVRELEPGAAGPGVDMDEVADSSTLAPLILWNRRWEYDKNPGELFASLYRLHDQDVPFRLALCGEQFAQRSPEFDEAMERLGERVVHVGHLELPAYRRMLRRVAVVPSTAHHEFFGIAVVEAIAAGAFPVLPRRLSYPELLPARFHARCLYDDVEGLDAALLWALTERGAARSLALELAQWTGARFAWSAVALGYDRCFERLRHS